MEHPQLRKAAEHGGILSARRRPIMIGDTDLDALFKRLHLANARRVWRDVVMRAERETWSRLRVTREGASTSGPIGAKMESDRTRCHTGLRLHRTRTARPSAGQNTRCSAFRAIGTSSRRVMTGSASAYRTGLPN